jgi:Spy/CpxP family protein refolding chaperone
MNTSKIQISENTVQEVSMHAWLYFCLFFMLASFALSYNALAFRGDFAKNLDNRMAILSEKLQLTDDQIEKIRPILENQTNKRKEIFEAHSSQGFGDRRVLRNQMRALREETRSQVKHLLTEEQIEKYEAWQQEGFQKMQNRRERSHKNAGSKMY